MKNLQLNLFDSVIFDKNITNSYDFDNEHNTFKEHGGCVCGIDEAGRGCLAGDVFAAAVVLGEKPNSRIEGLNDSKKLSESKRETLYTQIIENCKAYAIATASVAEIEELNILGAALLAMKRAYEDLQNKEPQSYCTVLVDGNKLPPIGQIVPNIPSVHSNSVHEREKHEQFAMRCIVGGDAKSAAIAAASILAKVARDRYMLELDRLYPEYQFAKHKSYATKLHRELILKHGASPVHRKSFLKKLYMNK